MLKGGEATPLGDRDRELHFREEWGNTFINRKRVLYDTSKWGSENKEPCH